MKKKTNLLTAVMASLLLIIACQKESENPTPEKKPDIITIVSTSFQGLVRDESGAPLAGVDITAGSKTTRTDAYGIFRITDVLVPDLYGNVKAEKTGYFPGSRAVLTNTDGYNFVEIQLIKRNLSGTIESSSSTTIDIATSVSVTFSGNSFVTKNGTPYSGKVNVYGVYLDPESPEFVRIMPGDLRGINTNNNITGLLSFGMMAVELEGTGGEQLQLAEGNKVTISTAIPPSMLSVAPTTLPLWFFDEAKGIWIEEGLATKSGNKFTGEVSHFTFWNFDAPADFVYASLTLLNQENDAIPYTLVKITDTRNLTYGIGYTDSTGYIKMWVPKNAPLQLNVINTCNEIIHTKNVGPYSNDAEIGEIAVAVQAAGVLEISGTAVTCENQAVTDGYVNVAFGGLNYRAAIDNGDFKVIINRCNTALINAEISAVDMSTLKQSDLKAIGVTSGIYNAGQLMACENEATEFFSINLAGMEYEWTTPPDTLIFKRTGQASDISIIKNATGQGIGIKLTDTVPHQGYSAVTIYIYENARRYYGDSLVYNVTKYGRKNEYIEFDFSGQVRTDSANTGDWRQVSGNALIRRRF